MRRRVGSDGEVAVAFGPGVHHAPIDPCVDDGLGSGFGNALRTATTSRARVDDLDDAAAGLGLGRAGAGLAARAHCTATLSAGAGDLATDAALVAASRNRKKQSDEPRGIANREAIHQG